MSGMVKAIDHSKLKDTPMVYLAGPIDFVSPTQSGGWRNDASDALGRLAISAYNPASAFGGFISHEVTAIAKVNMAAMNECQGAIFMIDSTVPQFGTPMEFYMWVKTGKPMAVIVQVGVLPMYVRLLSKCSHRTVNGAVVYLSNQLNGVLEE